MDDEQSYFASISINPQGQLCLSLNRPLIFATSIDEVLTLGPTYGTGNRERSSTAAEDGVTTSSSPTTFHLLHYSTQEGSTLNRLHSLDAPSSDLSEAMRRSLHQLDLSEGRSLLVLGLLGNLLKARGRSVVFHTSIPKVLQIRIPMHTFHPPLTSPSPFHIHTCTHTHTHTHLSKLFIQVVIFFFL